MKIVMLGIVGAGKGTQARKISEYLKIPHISTGDIFREASESGSELGKKARDIMNSGNLVPDDIVLGIVQERLNKDDVKSGYILDGFPRTISQAEEFNKYEDLDRVYYINLPEDEVLKRLLGRRVCPTCNNQYNIYLADDPDENCSVCGSKLVAREDDTEDTIKIRIENYKKQTKPLVDYYDRKNILKTISGDQVIEKVFEEIKKSL